MKRIIILLIAMLFIGTMCVAGSVLYISSIVTRPLTIEQDTFFTIEKGSNAYRTVKQLRNNGVTQVSPFIAKVWLKFFAGNTSVKSGTYLLSSNLSLVECHVAAHSEIAHTCITYIRSAGRTSPPDAPRAGAERRARKGLPMPHQRPADEGPLTGML